MELWTLIVIVMLTEFGLHYFPWRTLCRGKELPRLAAYTLGLLGMMGPLTAWLWVRGEIEVIQTMWAVIVSAGVTVFAAYGLDHYLDLIMRDIESSEREEHYGTRQYRHTKKAE
jgi:hypothetical protein